MSNVAMLDPVPYPWLSARTRNALRRRALISIVSGVTFLMVLLGLVAIPRQVTRAARTTPPRALRPDTVTALSRQGEAAAALAHADTTLAAVRRRAMRAATAAVPPQLVDTLAPELRAERDSLTALLTALSRAIEHAAEAPLPPSFRALAQSPALHGDPKVRVWLDSLNQVDTLRAPFGALGAGDPIYVALTARMNELGRSIRDAATAKRSELRARLAPLVSQSVVVLPTAIVPIDTTTLVTSRAAAARAFTTSTHTLDSMRAQNARIDATLAHARELANLGAPPMAMLAAAFVIALAFGFGVAFMDELRNPRIAHVRETEQAAGMRVLSVIRPTEVVERSRRQSDRDVLPLVDIVSESYRTLYLHLAATGASVPIITVTGASTPIVATVATNLAAAAAYEARSTLLVDVDVASNAVASVLRISSNPGLAGILAGQATLPEAIVSTTIGRDRPLDVLPSGTGHSGPAKPELIAEMGAHFTRMERRYDFIVIAAQVSYVQRPLHTVISAPDVIVCAHIGKTPLAELRATVKSLRGVGRYIHGIVLWDDELPRLSPYQSHG